MPWLRSLVVLALWGPIAVAGDWPQWLGPNRDASSPEKVAPWKMDLKVLWRHAAGEGNSGPVVANGRVFLHTKVADKNEEQVIAYDAKSGKELWLMTYPRAAISSPFGNGPRATPTVTGERVYTFGITGVLNCLNAASGERVWHVDTLEKLQAKNLFFGMSCSPLVEGKHVLVNVGAKGASVVAFDKGNGGVLWKSLDDRASYSSPIGIDANKARQVLFLTGQGLVSLNPADGSLYWRFPLVDFLQESSTTPARAGDLVLASSITVGSVGLRLQAKDGKPGFQEAWKNADLTSYFSTPVAVGKEHVYLVTGTKPALGADIQATLYCIETASGKELWKRPKVGKYHASLLRTGDNKLLMLDDAGHLILLDPSPEKYQELARSRVCGETWAHPALANGRLYVRDNKELICLQLKEEN